MTWRRAIKLTSHRTESVYRRYATVSEWDLSEGAWKLAQLYQETKTGTAPLERNVSRSWQSRPDLASPSGEYSNRLACWLRAMDTLRQAIGAAA